MDTPETIDVHTLQDRRAHAPTHTTNTPTFLRACRREAVVHTPVWFMRQAGRSLPEFREARKRHSLLEITRQPDLCAEVTLQPVRRLGVDAAIVVSDIVAPLINIGVAIDLVENVGPVIAQPIRSQADLAALRPLEPAADMGAIQETLRIVRRALAGQDVALIGFVGAPFTLAGYLVEGKPSRDFIHTKQMMLDAPTLWDALMTRLTEITLAFARGQIAAGAQAIQVFDSWVGALSPRDYARHVQPHMRRLFDGLRAPGFDIPSSIDLASIPRIHFGTGTATLLELMAEAGGDVIGLDWRVPLDDGWARLGGPARVAIQGNLDPVALTASWEALHGEAADVLARAGGRPGHIFNLGHGVLPTTPVENLERLVAFVHAYNGER
ncbi:MAG TPA: uroporphyrinogen decarboxylase [Ktedonobacterales bacterium]|nr:uroporphyrinogen decarboxylase [Ktedonobacterales bacterium]